MSEPVDASPGPESSRNRGGRPSNEERRRRLRSRLENVDITIAEQALEIAMDRKASPATRVQSLQVLVGLELDLDSRRPGRPNAVPDLQSLIARIDRFLEEAAERARTELKRRDGLPVSDGCGESIPEADARD